MTHHHSRGLFQSRPRRGRKGTTRVCPYGRALRYIAVTVIVAIGAGSAQAQHSATETVGADSGRIRVTVLPQYTIDDSLAVVTLLSGVGAERERQESALTLSTLIVHFARQLLGVPYVGHTLEVNDEERLIVNMRAFDCTTYTETVLALAMSIRQGEPTFAAYCRNLQTLRYMQGTEPHYTTRLHYFTGWIEDNTAAGLCREIAEPSPPFSAVQTVDASYMTTHVSRYRMLAANADYLPGIRAQEQAITGRTYRYIPQEQLYNNAALREAVHDGDIIAIVTNVKGLDTQHIGLAVWHDDGLHLLNASSIHKQTIEEPMTLRQYLYRHPTMIGVRVVRPVF